MPRLWRKEMLFGVLAYTANENLYVRVVVEVFLLGFLGGKRGNHFQDKRLMELNNPGSGIYVSMNPEQAMDTFYGWMQVVLMSKYLHH